MRISNYQKESIKFLANQYFGKDCRVYLFGSRVDESKRGGDIDLYIETYKDGAGLDDKIGFLTALEKKIGEQKIDLILNNGRCQKPIFEVARSNGVIL